MGRSVEISCKFSENSDLSHQWKAESVECHLSGNDQKICAIWDQHNPGFRSDDTELPTKSLSVELTEDSTLSFILLAKKDVSGVIRHKYLEEVSFSKENSQKLLSGDRFCFYFSIKNNNLAVELQQNDCRV